MTTERSGMSLEQVRDFLRAEYDMCMAQPRLKDIAKTNDYLRASEAIDAHLSRDAVVSDEDIERAWSAWNTKMAAGIRVDERMRAALSSFAARHAAVPDEIDLTSAPAGWPNAESACYAAGWNACRETMLAQRDGDNI